MNDKLDTKNLGEVFLHIISNKNIDTNLKSIAQLESDNITLLVSKFRLGEYIELPRINAYGRKTRGKVIYLHYELDKENKPRLDIGILSEDNDHICYSEQMIEDILSGRIK